MIKQKITSAMAVSAIMLSACAPGAFASSSIDISGNGAFSSNGASVMHTSSMNLSQTNNSNFQNNVSSNANSGGNASSFNTGGSTGVTSGSASSHVDIHNMGGMNMASLTSCTECGASNAMIKIHGNGAFSQNGVNANSSNSQNTSQQTTTQVSNSVQSNANSGNNNSSFNTQGMGMSDWNSWYGGWLGQSGWVWQDNCWKWNGNSNMPNWWNNWFMNNGWSWNNNSWTWNSGNNTGGSMTQGSGQATSSVSIHNAAGTNTAH